MSSKSNPTLIGGFVVGAIALLALAVSIFGGAQLLAPKTIITAYFPGSVKGLRVGSNVLFRGVRVGFVSEITLLGDLDSLEPTVRADLEITPETWVLVDGGRRILPGSRSVDQQRLLDAGLRARLNIESFVTGQLVVEMDFLPDTEIVLRALEEDHDEFEVPTVPSDVEILVERFERFLGSIDENVDIQAMAEHLTSALAGVDELVNSSDLRDTLAAVKRLTEADSTQQLPANLEAVLADARVAIGSFDTLMGDLDDEVKPLVADVRQAVARLDSTLASADAMMDTIERQLGDDAGIEYEMASALQEARAAARALRVFVEYLERNPEALLRGKAGRDN